MILLKKIGNLKKVILLSGLLSLVGCSQIVKNQYQPITQDELNAYYTDIPFDMPQVQLPVFNNYEVSIVKFGAVADGQALNTEAIQEAIDHVAEKGGGRVVIPEGTWLTGPITLKSNVNLHAEVNSLIVFSPDYNLYPIVDASFEGLNTKRAQSPITVRNAENVAITGQGVFNGAGDAWRPVKRDKMTEKQFKDLIKSGGVLSDDGKMWFPSEASKRANAMCVDQNVPVGPQTDEEWLAIHDFLRPVLINIISSKNVLLDGVTFENSPSWNIHPLMSENVVLSNLTVRNPWYSQNGDGVDLESCKNSLIVNCNFDVGDDAICMKSGKNEDGRNRNMPTENVIVKNCVVYHGHGGFVVGSEMSGDVRNIWVSSCSFIGTDVGLRFKSTRGRGGVVENIYITDINMVNIPTDPLLFDLFYGGKAPGEEDDNTQGNNGSSVIPPVTVETPSFRDIYIKNVVSNGSNRAMYFNGLPEMKVKNIVIENSIFKSKQGAVINHTDGVILKNVQIDRSKGNMVSISNVDNAVFENVVSSKGEKLVLNKKGENKNIALK
ncbi:glycoside hydrolase family 28 protein [Paludibacter sp. 221]|uniref:glycoside hydrolase family 28 protein n=1 Tax=Paludibacter sp. 221 TaxID=2302939 RepID=UPI0013D42A77|nr:glycoside hydrolase family 28 protein [Paludibacter sp. 221]NDV47095.1 glycoside hydrolase family 28 protein [Paludibacter sp. 221]